MTYRERREAKAARLRDWAEKRDAKAEAASKKAHEIMDGIPMGQPILVGHHSEKRHRKDLERIDNGIRAWGEHTAKAQDMRSRADGIADQLDRSIYSDDPDAIERLEERIEALEAEQAALKAANVTYRKEHKAELAAMGPYMRNQSMPAPTWALSNLSANIRRNKERLAQLRTAAERPHTLRTITARRRGRCDSCDSPILPDVMQITEIEPHRWIHSACANAELSRARDGWTPENSID